jgi:multiple antibiotic resistance protein
VPAFQIMGGILFLTNALRTLVADDRRAYNVGGEKRMEDHDVEKAEIDPTSIAIVPLAVPMLSGPGAITSVMVLVNLYPYHRTEDGRAVLAKIMALLLGAIGIQFIINGVTPIAVGIMKAS